jgi:hypothetical protein
MCFWTHSTLNHHLTTMTLQGPLKWSHVYTGCTFLSRGCRSFVCLIRKTCDLWLKNLNRIGPTGQFATQYCRDWL